MFSKVFARRPPIAMRSAEELPQTPPVSISEAVMSRWVMVVAAAVVLAIAGATVALVRPAKYTATVQLQVGRIDTTSPGALSGFALATQSLATAYSRAIDARAVVTPVAAKTGLSSSEVKSSLSSTPIAESPSFNVQASETDPRTAIALANDASQALVSYAAVTNQRNPNSSRLLTEFRSATVLRKLARQDLQSALVTAAHGPTPAAQADVAKAQGAVDTANLRVEALGSAYSASVQSQAAADLIVITSPATKASSDRQSVLLILVFLGLLVGLLIGATAATVMETRDAQLLASYRSRRAADGSGSESEELSRSGA